ncbi:MAG: hypothetical protein GY796_34445 [Chloroflexi bacterium]|nr:hypothetical protein [Chloroflexota bacterium]
MQESTLEHEPIEISDPLEDVLEHGWLHKTMVLFHQSAQWPSWLLVVLLLALSTISGSLWYLITKDKESAQNITILLGLLMTADMTLLISLPQRGLSFGPWKAQFVVLIIPRILAIISAALIGAWLGINWGIVVFVSLQLLAMAALVWGAEIEPFRLQLTEFLMFSDRLPPGSDPIRILHISDLHLERLTKREEKVVALAYKAKPDLIVITGDYVNLSYNRDPKTHAQIRQLLRQFRAPHGVYATLGSPPVDLRETVPPLFDGLKISLMRHAWRKVEMGHGRQLILLGMDCTHHLPTDTSRLNHLVNQAPNNAPQLLLYHSPELMPEAVEHGIDLYLCGHTHGGQVRLPFIGPLLTSSQLGRKFVMGLYRHDRTHLYVSRGIGLEGLSAPRVRFMCPPEMTLVTIRPSSPTA